MPSQMKLGTGLTHLEAFKRLHGYPGQEPPVKEGWWYSTHTNTVEYWSTCPNTLKLILEQYHISPSIRDRDIVNYFHRKIRLTPFRLTPQVSDI